MAKQDDYVRYTIRVPADLYKRVQQVAEKNNRSVNAEIVAGLEDGYKPMPETDEEAEAMLERVRQQTTELMDIMGILLASLKAKKPKPSSEGQE